MPVIANKDLESTLSPMDYPFIIDVTDTEAFLVRKNGDTGDVFAVNTTSDIVTINADLLFGTGKAIQTGTTAGDTLLFKAYDVGTTSYTTMATIAAHATDPTWTFNEDVYITSGKKIMGVTSGNYVDLDTSSNVLIFSNGNMVNRSDNNLAYDLDFDNNTSGTASFEIRADAALVSVWKMVEHGVGTHNCTATGGTAMTITANSLTTGFISQEISNSPSTASRTLKAIINENSAAVNTLPFLIRNDAFTDTNFRLAAQFNGVKFWVSNGIATPNGALTGSAGDICLNGASNQSYYCTGTTNWTAM